MIAANAERRVRATAVEKAEIEGAAVVEKANDLVRVVEAPGRR